MSAPRAPSPVDPMTSISAGSSVPGHSAAHTDLVRSLEMTGMASVAAARAVQAAASGVIVGGSVKQVIRRMTCIFLKVKSSHLSVIL